MEPAQIIILCAIAVGGFFLWFHRDRLRESISAVLMQILDAIVVGYVSYLVVASVFDFASYKTWAGAVRILFFAGTFTGVQDFAILFGAVVGFLRIFTSERSSGTDTVRRYVGGRKIWCHSSALAVANSLLATRTAKSKLSLPQHLLPTVDYRLSGSPEQLDKIVPLTETENRLELTPYVSKSGEYETVLWGALRIPYEMTPLHFLTVGATGSGKTLQIHGLMKSVLPRIKTDKNFRAFIYDDKPDFMPFARQLKLEKYVWSFDPFDADGYAWDIAADVTTTAEALQVASVLAPIDPTVKDPFWQRATQDFLGAVLLNFHEVNKDKWTLRDVVLAFSSEQRLRNILARDPDSERMARLYLGSKALRDVLAVLQSKLNPYSVAAALYETAGNKKRSVREWHKSNAILLVTGRSIFSQAVKPINQALFRMVSLLILNEPDHRPADAGKLSAPSNWIFLDEIREIGKLEGYHELANKGRSKGARLVLGFQSIEGMATEHTEDAANEIANLCAHRTFLHTTSVVTREWEARQVGNIVIDETVFNHSESVGKDGAWTNGTSWQTNRQTRAAMEASDFDQNLKLATPETGVTALNFIPYIGTYISWVPWSWVLTNLPFPKQKFFVEKLRDGPAQKIKDWSSPDFTRLAISPLIDHAPPSKQKDTPKADEKNDNNQFGSSQRMSLE